MTAFAMLATFDREFTDEERERLGEEDRDWTVGRARPGVGEMDADREAKTWEEAVQMFTDDLRAVVPDIELVSIVPAE